ncbi:MAG: hypothetical protein EHM19_11605, partial [Candidatus Latescibacterota bacterium]
AAAGALALNGRFLDQASTGYFVFLLLPLAASIPAGLLARIVVRAAGEGPGRLRFYQLFSLLVLVPSIGWLVHGEIARLFAGSSAVILALFGIALAAIAAGALALGRLLARLLLRGGEPRMSALLIPLAALVLLPPIGAALSGRPIAWDGEKRVLVLGVDAATWRIIDPLVEKGRLPTFRALMEEGTRFDLESIPPLMSPILWTTIGSGVPSDVHGLESFYGSSSDVREPRLWDIAEEKGWTVGVLGWPVSWPPRPVPGFLIPSLFARGPETYPPDFQFMRELEMSEKGERTRDPRTYAEYAIRMVQNGVKLSTLREASRVLFGRLDYTEKTVAQRNLKLFIHGDIFIELWERYQPRFASFYDNTVDVTCHYAWKYFDPEHFPDVTAEQVEKYGDMIPGSYEATDRALGRILRFAPEDLVVVVVSDHGQQATETEASGAVRIIRTESFLERLGLAESVEGVNLASAVHLRAKKGSALPEGLDAFIRDVVVERTGESVFNARIDELGNFIVSVRPEPPIVGERLVVPGGTSFEATELVNETYAKISGEHSLDAILLVKGPEVRRGARGGHADLYDVAPTTLYLMGLPVGEKMVGRVLESAFVEGILASRPPATEAYTLEAVVPDAGEEAGDSELKEQLRALGYLQ